jgi:hypothetical protein
MSFLPLCKNSVSQFTDLLLMAWIEMTHSKIADSIELHFNRNLAGKTLQKVDKGMKPARRSHFGFTKALFRR